MAKVKLFHDKRIVVTLEEGLLLVIGIVFGWFAGKGATVLLWVIPIVLIVMFILEYFYLKKHGKHIAPPFKKKRR